MTAQGTNSSYAIYYRYDGIYLLSIRSDIVHHKYCAERRETKQTNTKCMYTAHRTHQISIYNNIIFSCDCNLTKWSYFIIEFFFAPFFVCFLGAHIENWMRYTNTSICAVVGDFLCLFLYSAGPAIPPAAFVSIRRARDYSKHRPNRETSGHRQRV